MAWVTGVRRLLARLNTVLVIVLAVTGAYMALFYRADPIDAYGTTLRIQNSVFLGRLARGLHYHSANILLVTALLHVISFALPARERPVGPWRSFLLALALPAAAVTGAVLRWDQVAYWSTQRVLYLVSTVPVLGPVLVGEGTPVVTPGFLRGSWQFHVLILPAIALLAWYYPMSRRGDARAPRD